MTAPDPQARRPRLVLAAVLLAALATVVAIAIPLWPRGSGFRDTWCGPLRYQDCMPLIEGGTFLMGAQADNPHAPGYDPAAEPDEGPPHEVTLSPYYMDLQEVTAEGFSDCVAAGACRDEDAHRGGGYFNHGRRERMAHPANGVSWRGARDFCAWIGARLPTEAEWEFAARGQEGWRFSWGDEEPACDDDPSRMAHEGCPTDGTTLIGLATMRSPTGTVAQSGGVWEWVSDWYGADYYAVSPELDPQGPAEGVGRVQRGGSWQSEEVKEMRAAYRAQLPPDSRFADVGFRCARTPTEADRVR